MILRLAKALETTQNIMQVLQVEYTQSLRELWNGKKESLLHSECAQEVRRFTSCLYFYTVNFISSISESALTWNSFTSWTNAETRQSSEPGWFRVKWELQVITGAHCLMEIIMWTGTIIHFVRGPLLWELLVWNRHGHIISHCFPFPPSSSVSPLSSPPLNLPFSPPEALLLIIIVQSIMVLITAPYQRGKSGHWNEWSIGFFIPHWNSHKKLSKFFSYNTH